jgi:hypothetical protein
VVNHLVRDLLPVLDLPTSYAAEHLDLADGNGLPSSLPVNTLGCGAVAAAALAGLALRGGERVHVDPQAVAVSFRADQLMSVEGLPVPSFAPLSGFFEAADGWVRTHANYPHHRDRLLRALDLPAGSAREEVAGAIRATAAGEVEDLVTADHGVAVRVRSMAQWRASEQFTAVASHDLLEVRSVGDAPASVIPARPRVLDLTRVLAGPVATRTLALFGCDVLRVDSPRLPELESLHLDTGSGKRSTLVDLHNPHARERLHALLDEADVLVTGYRPGALAAYGLDPDRLASTHPQLVCATLTAWTPSGPWGCRRGFDSIVQAATGLALLESVDGRTPGALPAQVLDHATGYLLAAGIASALRRRTEVGGTWRVSAHLARTAHWLLQTDALDAPSTPVDPDPWLVEAATESGRVRLPRPAFRIDGAQSVFAWVGHRWGTDEARWL